MIIGHEPQRKELAGLPASAIILRGPDGVGKRAMVLDLALGLVNAVDILEMGPDIRIGEARGLVEWGSLRPFCSDRKIAIVDVGTITTQAGNALLKILEEPPKCLTIVLVAGRDNLLDTIVSRCWVVDFGSLSDAHMREVLESLGIRDNELDHLVEVGQGSVGRALALREYEYVVHSVETYLLAVTRKDWSLLVGTVQTWRSPHIRMLGERLAQRGDLGSLSLLRGKVTPSAIALVVGQGLMK